MKVISLSHVWLCDPVDCRPPGSSVHGILQARILEWIAIPFSIFLNGSIYLYLATIEMEQQDTLCEEFLNCFYINLVALRDTICWIIKTSIGLLKKDESSRKTSISALLTMQKILTECFTTNGGKFLKRWESQNTWPASWEVCMQVKKQHTGSK